MQLNYVIQTIKCTYRCIDRIFRAIWEIECGADEKLGDDGGSEIDEDPNFRSANIHFLYQSNAIESFLYA